VPFFGKADLSQFPILITVLPTRFAPWADVDLNCHSLQVSQFSMMDIISPNRSLDQLRLVDHRAETMLLL